MGVKGLWRLLLPIGRRISIETLEGQILAIDASIWLTQFLTVAARQREQELLGNNDGISNSNSNSGRAYSYDYLVGFLRRLCKLRYMGIRPVLVFDGATPEIKRRELSLRLKRRKRNLGDYLGGGIGDEENDGEAARRMAKRILAKQLRTGKLVTTKRRKVQEAGKETPGNGDVSTEPNTKHPKSETQATKAAAAIASASYAPGFYDPDASVVTKQAKQSTTPKNQNEETNEDDDHLLREDYNSNPLTEEINDWDRPIVVDSDDEDNAKNLTQPTHLTHPPKERRQRFPRNKKKNRLFGSAASKLHSGDGTDFQVESVANLPESARKDVIEDAQKQRRLASRREFMMVASDPDGLSSCQLSNFLKSTRLNRDIAAMARAAKAKAEEEAKMKLGNGILFEKEDGTVPSLRGSNSSNIYAKRNKYTAASRQHYRSTAYQSRTKLAGGGRMRLFHHKNQLPEGKAFQNNDEAVDDEHDFRKKRNNHYLSGGIRFVASDEEEDVDEHEGELSEEQQFGGDGDRSRTKTANPKDGGFVLAVTDGSDQPRNKLSGNTTTGSGSGELIEIDASSDESDGENESDDDRKPSPTDNTKASQELQDEALARALQNMEEQDATVQDTGEDAVECIGIDDSDDGGGFFQNSLPEEPTEIDPLSRQERDDARLALQLQESEYREVEDRGDGGDFLDAETNEECTDMEEEMDGGGGFLVSTPRDDDHKAEISDSGARFLVPTSKVENQEDGGVFLVPTRKEKSGITKSQSQSMKSDPFSTKQSRAKILNGIFATSQQRKVQTIENNLLVSRDSSEDEEEEDEEENVDWEDGTGNNDNDNEIDREEDSKKLQDVNGAMETKERQFLQQYNPDILSKNDVKDSALVDALDHDADDDSRSGDEEIGWEDGDVEINESTSGVIDLREEKKSYTMFKQPVWSEADGDDDEVDWEDGDDETNKSKTEVIDLCEESEAPKDLKAPKLIKPDGSNCNQEGGDKSNVSTSPTNGKDGPPSEGQCNSTDEATEQAISHKAEEETSKYFDATTKPPPENKPKSLDDDSEGGNSMEWEPGESRTTVDDGDWGTTKTQNSDEVAAALLHAQGTAANLTNWAGRAFRRAIAQHAIENGMKIPESAKPGVLKNTRSDTKRDSPIPNEVDNNVRTAQNKSQARIQPKKRDSLNQTLSGKKVDNSDWLDTVDTTDDYVEDYTVPPQEANPSDRLLDTSSGGVTEEMRTEVMQLLRLFGIPYVVAPAEAEAQCVELERLGLIDGIVTEDSDTFVFGGQVIYKNIFEDKKYVEVYHAKDASEEMNLTQDALVALAMLLGGDYTEGVKGVGIVNGMEVLQAFDVDQNCKAGLIRFRKWLDGFDPKDLTKDHKSEDSQDAGNVRSEKEQVFHRKHHTARTRWIAPKHFPDAKVLNAYLNPVVDASTERFSWGIPDLDGLIAFCHGHMGWVAEETTKLIAPIIQRMEEGSMRQTRIDSFMRYEDGIKFAKIQSKRLRQVLGLSSRKSASTKEPVRNNIFAAATASGNEDEETGSDEFDEEEDFFGEPQEIFDAIDAASQAHPAPTTTKKRYNGKRTRSLAALSSASASTVAIASSSKGDEIPGNHNSTGNASAAAARHRRSIANLPKKAPPAYQKQSSAILEEEKDNAAEPHGDTRTNGYEVINPSMI